MLIGICGGTNHLVMLVSDTNDFVSGICAGKNSVAEYLTKNHGFSRLYLPHDKSISTLHITRGSHDAEQRQFSDIDSLLQFITKQWKRRWVTTDVWNEGILENLLRRPSFILVSVDAPVSLRWKRFKDR